MHKFLFISVRLFYIAHTKWIQMRNYLLIWGINVWWVCLHASTHCLLTLRIFSRNSGASLAVPTWIKRSRNVAIWTFRSHITWNFQINFFNFCFCFVDARNASATDAYIGSIYITWREFPRLFFKNAKSITITLKYHQKTTTNFFCLYAKQNMSVTDRA